MRIPGHSTDIRRLISRCQQANVKEQIMLDPESRIIVELSDPSLQTNPETDAKGIYAITLVDTGATFNVINEVCWEQLGCLN